MLTFDYISLRIFLFIIFYFIINYSVSGGVLRNSEWLMGAQWTANQGPSNDLRSIKFLQFHGRCRYLSPANLCNETATGRFS